MLRLYDIRFMTSRYKVFNNIRILYDNAYQLGASGIEFNKIFIQGRAKKLSNIGLAKEDYDSFLLN